MSWAEAFGQAVGKHHCFGSSLLLLPCSPRGMEHPSTALHLPKASFAVGRHTEIWAHPADPCGAHTVRNPAQLCWQLRLGQCLWCPWMDHGWTSLCSEANGNWRGFTSSSVWAAVAETRLLCTKRNLKSPLVLLWEKMVDPFQSKSFLEIQVIVFPLLYSAGLLLS